jgi:trigger factor|tara:strand:+ start:1774 stop:3117 length:1344 start_codon:yes stop_codon:yes gene_type:complete
MSNTVKIEEAGPCRKKISIDVPATKVDEAMENAFAAVAHEAAIPGFRKGRAPRRLVEKRFGNYVIDETRSRLCASAYQEAVEENELKVLGHPPAEYFEDIEIEAGNPVHIEVEVEVMPEFDLPELKGIEVLKPEATLPDGIVDEEIKKIAINEGDLDEQDKSAKGNYLTGKAVMVDAEGTEHYNIDGAVIQIPEEGDEGMVLGVIVPDFTKQVKTPNEGDTVTIKVKGPENHEVEALRGKDLTVTFEVTKIYAIVPAPMADIVAKYGFASEDQLREMVTSRLEQRAAAQQQGVMRQQVLKYLSENIEFELPAGLTAQQAARSLERQRMELMYRGVDPTEIEQNMAQLRSASAARATAELKQFFIMNKIAESLEVQIEEAEINAQIVQMAMQQGKRPEQLRDELIKSGQAQALVQQVREHKTVDKILEDAKIEEVTADEFNKKFKDAD